MSEEKVPYYWILNTTSTRAIIKLTPATVGTYMLGRQFMDYIIIKCDDSGDRCYDVKNWSGDVMTLQKDLELL